MVPLKDSAQRTPEDARGRKTDASRIVYSGKEVDGIKKAIKGLGLSLYVANENGLFSVQDKVKFKQCQDLFRNADKSRRTKK